MHKENALEKSQLCGAVSLGDQRDGNFSHEAVLVYTRPTVIVYNSNLIPKDKRRRTTPI
jgi:hypothetical protein